MHADRGLREQVLFELAKRDKSDIRETLRAITEEDPAAVVDVARASVWRLSADSQSLHCQDQFRRDVRGHEEGMVIYARDFPTYFRALGENRVISADDARTDPRTRELSASYLAPLHIESMMDVPIWHQGSAVGVLCHEHIGPARHWSSADETFAANMADLVSLSLEAGERRDAECRWQAVVDSIAEAVFVLDAEGRLVRMNPMARHMSMLAGGSTTTLAERQQRIEFRDATGKLIPPERTAGSRSLKGEVVRGEILQTLFKHSGERRFYRVTSAPLTDGGRVHHVVTVMTDITEEAFVERLKRELLAALAHELKTPVAIVKGYAQHLGQLPETGPPTRRMLGAIDRATMRMERLINDLIDVSGFSLGRLVLTREQVELTGLVRSVVEHARSGTRHLLQLSAPEPVWVLADRPRLEQAIRRLLDNAIRYSPEHTAVELEVAAGERDAILSVRDRGVGIPAEQQSRIFELFFRAHAGTAHDMGGLGMGLYLAREITTRHGGKLWFESAEGQGSTFYLSLPRVQPS